MFLPSKGFEIARLADMYKEQERELDQLKVLVMALALKCGYYTTYRPAGWVLENRNDKV